MKSQKWGLVGIGRLGQALLTQIEQKNLIYSEKVQVSIYHPEPIKAKLIKERYPFIKVVRLEELNELHYLILALPASKYHVFIEECQEQQIPISKPLLINMATANATQDLEMRFPQLRWMGMKFMGHAEDLRKYDDGLFVTNKKMVCTDEEYRVIRFFSRLGKVVLDDEGIVEQINKMATRFALESVIQFQSELEKSRINHDYKKRAILSIFPEIVRSYGLGTLGHFAQEIADEIENKSKTQDDLNKNQ